MSGMASFLKQTISFQLAVVVFITATVTKSLSSPLMVKKISTISAAPAMLPSAPMSSPAPDVSPLLPSPSGIVPSPSDMMPTIPSNPSPPNPDETAGTGPNSAASPSGSFPAVASIPSVATPLGSAGCSRALCFGLVLICLLHLLGCVN